MNIKYILLLVALLCTETIDAQVVRRTIAVDQPGSLISHLTLEEAQSITHLTIAGIINAVDFKYMRADFKSLQVLDISKAEIRAYAGKSGTYPNEKFYIYPPNCVPAFAFCSVRQGDTLGMPALREVYLSDKIKNIEDGAFKRCDLLRICRIDKRTPPNLLKGGLDPNITAVFVPEYCVDAYRAKSVWAPFACLDTRPVRLHVILHADGGLQNAIQRAGLKPDEVHFLILEGTPSPEDIKTISSLMNNLVEVDLTHADMKEIPEFAFIQKKNLLRVHLPRTLQRIGQRAFSGCTRLSGVLTLPPDVRRIDYGAFSGCTRLKQVVATGNIRIEVGGNLFGDESSGQLIYKQMN